MSQQDIKILKAVWANVVSWFVRTLFPSLLSRLLPAIPEEDTNSSNNSNTKCVVIGRPGGGEQLRLISLKPGKVTTGYNVQLKSPFMSTSDLPPDCVVLENEAFSVNYADCCIRWGLYESANKYVGYPICPGFDVAGTVSRVGTDVKGLQPGDRVFGCSLFGSYSTRLIVPEVHLRQIPSGLTTVQAASIPTVALTALYALFLAGHYPGPSPYSNKAILIHSAAGGVGGMLVQMSKHLGFSPIVGVVGRPQKVQAAKDLGCDVVIDRSSQDLWHEVEKASSNGYSAVMDASGVQTLLESYKHLAIGGRLIVYGFHTNLPVGKDCLSPFEWIRMAIKKNKMPLFDPMEMGTDNKSVFGFNLSFFANERDMLSNMLTEIIDWIKAGKINCPRVVDLPMDQIREAHDLIQSGKTIGKLVLTTA